MEFRLLGPVEAWRGGSEIPLDGTKQRTVLAALLLSRGRMVTDSQLSSMLWGENLPNTYYAQIYTYVSRLRKHLGSTVAITRRRPGYLMNVGAARVDFEEFELEAALGQEALKQRRYAEATQHLRTALACWRGPALANVTEFLTSVEAHRLEEARMVALESRIEADLQLGHATELASELTGLVADHPLRERLRAQLMVALYRCDRQGDALAVYHEGRRILSDEMGSDPGPTLTRVYRAVLTDDPDLNAPVVSAAARTPARAVPLRPAMLPPDVTAFVGRTQEVEGIRRLLRPTAEHHTRSPGFPVITGMAGVGKSALAAHAAHGVIGAFPDGQLYADLGGAGRRPADPFEVLGSFLRLLGGEATPVPSSLSERSQVFRSWLADRRLLVMLDDAISDAQVAPLLASGSHSRVIVTSRARLSMLDSAESLDLSPFGADQALGLLTTLIGDDRVAAEPEAAARIVELCGRLPLSLRIVGARLASKPHWTLSRLVERLSDDGRRLSELSIGTMDVRESIWRSYERVGAQAQVALRRLSLLNVPDFPDWTAGAVIGESQNVGEDVTDALVDARLLETADLDRRRRPRHRFHDLVRLFARELAAREDTLEERREALDRAFGTWVAVAASAASRLVGSMRAESPASLAQPGVPKYAGALSGVLASDVVETSDSPLAWFESESRALSALAHQASASGRPKAASVLSTVIDTFHEAGARTLAPDLWTAIPRQRTAVAVRSGAY